MQAEYLKRRFEIKDDLHRLISGIELSRSLKTEEKEVKNSVNQLEVKGYDKQTVNFLILGILTNIIDLVLLNKCR